MAAGSKKIKRKRAAAGRQLPRLSPETRRRLVGIALLVAGAGTALSLLFPTNGQITGGTSYSLHQAAGWGAMALPVGLLWVGGALLRQGFDTRFGLRWQQIVGGCLLLLSFLGLLHLLPLGKVDLLARAQAGEGGGYAGYLLARAQVGEGGGYAGYLFGWQLLGSNLGVVGAGLIALAGILAGAAMLARMHPREAARTMVVLARASWLHYRNWRAARKRAVLINPAREPVVAQPKLATNPRPPAEAVRPETRSEPAGGAAAAQTGGEREWKLPTIELFEAMPEAEVSQVDIKLRIRVIDETLKSFGVDARVVEVNQGPAVTQFGVEPGVGVKVARIMSLGNDLALRLAAAPLRLEAPVPGKHVVGIEVPNGTVAVVSIRELLESPNFQKHRGRLRLALGRDVSGAPVIADLAKMPHLLIAGATGSGKSVCLNSFIATLLTECSPADLRLLMIDPKMVELLPFNGVPHLLSPVVTDVEKVVPTLKWVAKEMERRYGSFAARGVRNIEGYNKAATGKGSDLRLPYIVVVIDELADLMMTAPDEVEKVICRLAQLARATGIHLVVATQRPSVDVVTGLIKANFPTRISFAVTSMIDSRVILDQPGAEKLLGRGDMLYVPPESAKPLRVQGTYVSDAEITELVNYWKQARPPHFMGELPGGIAFVPVEEGDEVDDLYEEAMELISQHNRVSASLLQRRLGIGYNRASRLIDKLESEGIVGPSEHGRSREVLMRTEASSEGEDLTNSE